MDNEVSDARSPGPLTASTYCFHPHIVSRFFERDRPRPARRVPAPRNMHSSKGVLCPAGTKQSPPDFLDEAIGSLL